MNLGYLGIRVLGDLCILDTSRQNLGMAMVQADMSMVRRR